MIPAYEKLSENEKRAGVYFAIKKNTVMYIGSSTRPVERLKNHRYCGLAFDLAMFIPVFDEETRLATEKSMILLWRPIENKTHNPSFTNWQKKDQEGVLALVVDDTRLIASPLLRQELSCIGRKGGKVSSEAKSTAAIEREARKREAKEFAARLKSTRAKQ